MSTTKLSDWLDGEEFYERCMDIRSAVLPKDAHREFEGLQQAILRIASQEPRPAGVIGYEDRNGAVREIPADCQAFGAGGMPAALWVGDVRYVPVSVFADGAKPEAPVSDEQIAKAVRPLYSTDEAAEMGLADDILTVRAVLGSVQQASGQAEARADTWTPKSCRTCDGDQERCDPHRCGDAHATSPIPAEAPAGQGEAAAYPTPEMIAAGKLEAFNISGGDFDALDYEIVQIYRAMVGAQPATQVHPAEQAGAPEHCVTVWCSHGMIDDFESNPLADPFPDGEHKLYFASPAQQPVSAEADRERFLAIREGHHNAAEREYFDARPQIDTGDRRRVFYAGFCKGYDAALTPPQAPGGAA